MQKFLLLEDKDESDSAPKGDFSNGKMIAEVDGKLNSTEKLNRDIGVEMFDFSARWTGSPKVTVWEKFCRLPFQICVIF